MPGSKLSGVIQDDSITTGVKSEGVCGAARSFGNKIGTCIVIRIELTLTIIGGGFDQNIGRMGLKITALVGGIFCLLAFIVFALYKEKDVLNVIREARGIKVES